MQCRICSLLQIVVIRGADKISLQNDQIGKQFIKKQQQAKKTPQPHRLNMETPQFDAAIGGTEELPYSANSLKFAASRSIEIAAMTESILRPSNTKLIFQCLPVHMRRRVMSHNSKRLPRKLRAGHLEQLRKSGFPPKQKRPPRKYRRRPANLLQEYKRRQKRNIWLETHIWHAKRFHMIERWGHRLAYAPCDKAFRACYRASSTHCLLQDVSYYIPIQLTGSIEDIKEMFSHLTSPSCGLGICAKAYTTGNREGTVHFYGKDSFPNKYIGKIQFVWVPGESENRVLWLFVHPSQIHEVELTLTDQACTNESKESAVPVKRRKLQVNYSEPVQVRIMPGGFNRFRLTGPNSHAVLANSLKCLENVENIKTDTWVSSVSKNVKLHLKDKTDYWQKINTASSPSQLPSRLVIGIVVRDPRLSRPSKRTKAVPNCTQPNVESLMNYPKSISTSPLWDMSIQETIKQKIMTNGQFIEHVTKTQLVPGEVNLEDPAIQTVPVVLIQRPGSQDPNYKKLGYGSGWDIIIPPGYAIPFWHTFIMFGGRSGGLRETESLAFEMAECYLPPDSEAGKEEEKRIETELRERYFSLPPSKRVNFLKLAVNSPFICRWQILLGDWSGNSVDEFFILRDKKLLEDTQTCITKKRGLPQIENAANCLVSIFIQIQGKGNLKRHALICLPQPKDIQNIKNLLEPQHEDPNQKLRKLKKQQHITDLKKWRRRRLKLKKANEVAQPRKRVKRSHEPSEYVKSMRELWVPSNVENVRHSASREIMGYLAQGAFSFSEAKSCGIGYVPYFALDTLLKKGLNQILIRNTSSRKYRLASLQIVKNT